MSARLEYDFLNFTSFPSSRKIVNPTAGNAWSTLLGEPEIIVSVKPGSTLRVECNIKRVGAAGGVTMGYEVTWGAAVNVERRVPVTPTTPAGWAKMFGILTPMGAFNWTKFVAEGKVPSDVSVVRITYACARAKTVGGENVAWFDDLKLYQDGVLIYSNSFDNWNPYLGAGVGAVAGGVGGYLATGKPEYALAALPVALVGGIIGWLTAKP